LLGEQEPTAGEPTFEVREYRYDDTLPAGTELGTAGTAGLRFLHAGINAGVVTLVLVPATGAEMVLAVGATFGQISGLDGDLSRPTEVPVEDGPSRLEARGPEGQTLAVGSHAFVAGQIANVALINDANRLELLIF